MLTHPLDPQLPRACRVRAPLLGAALLLSAACWAQADAPAAPTAREAAPADRHSQRVEHIQLEDAGSRVDEVRSGGETRRITVQPKAEVPPYEVQPAGALNREAGPGAAGRRVWKIPF